MFESWFRGEVCKVDGIAHASSCLLINREWFLAMGGFRQAFAGHGYEDFDLIHRLVMYYPVGQRPADYPILKDATATLPEPLPGFQADTEILAVLKNGVFDSDTVLSDFPCWLREQQTLNGFPVEEYPGLFHFQAGVRKKNGGFWRKLRKLFLNPMAFFRDSVFVRKSWKKRGRSWLLMSFDSVLLLRLFGSFPCLAEQWFLCWIHTTSRVVEFVFGCGYAFPRWDPRGLKAWVRVKH